jgi:hypothetical protein
LTELESDPDRAARGVTLLGYSWTP